MAFRLTIPDSIVHSIKIPEARMAQSLSEELAVALYSDGFLSYGKARELAGVGKREFDSLLSQARTCRHYTEEELHEDLGYAGRQ